MTSVHLWWTSLIIFGAALLQSLTGFGFNLVASPLLTLIVEPRQSVPALILLWIPLGLWLMVRERRDINWQRVGLLLGGGLLGLPLVAIGMMSGALCEVSAMSGPPVVLSPISRDRQRRSLRQLTARERGWCRSPDEASSRVRARGFPAR